MVDRSGRRRTALSRLWGRCRRLRGQGRLLQRRLCLLALLTLRPPSGVVLYVSERALAERFLGQLQSPSEQPHEP